MSIKENIVKIKSELGPEVEILAATKKRTIFEIEEAISSGINIVGENYVKDAEEKIKIIGRKVSWHLIGHLQKNKVKKAVEIFDCIESVDSIDLALCLSRQANSKNKIIEIFVEINSARESQKTGVLPEKVYDFVQEIKNLPGLRITGIMTMGPAVDIADDIKPYFIETKTIFDNLKKQFLPDLKYLSMGMSDTYKIAGDCGANLVRIGTAIFGNR